MYRLKKGNFRSGDMCGREPANERSSPEFCPCLNLRSSPVSDITIGTVVYAEIPTVL